MNSVLSLFNFITLLFIQILVSVIKLLLKMKYHSIYHKYFGGSFETKRHYWLSHWPVDNGCYQWPKLIHIFLLKSNGQWIQIIWLVRRLGDYLLDLNFRSRSKHFEHVSIKCNIRIYCTYYLTQSEVLFFLMIADFLMEKLLNLSAPRVQQRNTVEDLHSSYFSSGVASSFEEFTNIFSTLYYICGIKTILLE